MTQAIPKYATRGLLIMGLLTACAASDTTEGGADPTTGKGVDERAFGPFTIEGGPAPLAEATLPGGSGQVQFLEVEPGHIVELEYRHLAEGDALPTEPVGLDSAQRYAFLTGVPAPAALVQAQNRVHQLERTKASQPVVSASLEGERVLDAAKGTERRTQSSRNWFRATYCKPTDRYEEYLYWSGNFDLGLLNANYYRGGIWNDYRSSGEVWGQLSYKRNDNVSGTMMISGNLSPGSLIALTNTSTINATVWMHAYPLDGNYRDYDVCYNWHQ